MTWRTNTLSQRDGSRHADSEWNAAEGYSWHCTGPCDQGRKSCPCPESCSRPQQEASAYGVASVLLLGLSGLLVVVLLGSAGAWLAERLA